MTCIRSLGRFGVDMASNTTKCILLIEPFYGGSHRQLIDQLHKNISGTDLYTTPAKKWPWRARTSALYFSQIIPTQHEYRVMFCSCVLNLAELVSIRPDLAALKKVVYFHENQLVYPVRQHKDRDFQFGYNQILTCLAADMVVFNSAFNMESFLGSIAAFLHLIPDHRPQNVADAIRPKCSVAYFPIEFPPNDIQQQPNEKIIQTAAETCPEKSETSNTTSEDNSENKDADTEDGEMITKPHQSCNTQNGAMSDSLLIVWPHRWEHDKNAELLFTTLYRLQAEGCKFKLAVLGETFTDVPAIFDEAKVKLAPHIVHWGFQVSKSDYYSILRESHVVVSTAKHEFFGVAMLEASYLGCYPLVPNDLVYPEIFPKECLYNTPQQLYKRLKNMCGGPQYIKPPQMDFTKYSWDTLQAQYHNLLKPEEPS